MERVESPTNSSTNGKESPNLSDSFLDDEPVTSEKQPLNAFPQNNPVTSVTTNSRSKFLRNYHVFLYEK